MSMAKQITFEIAGVSILIDCEDGLDEWAISAAYRPFVSERKADIHLSMLQGNPFASGSTQIFDSSPIWTLHRNGDTPFFKLFDHLSNEKRILVIDSDVRSATLYFPNPGGDFVDPFYGPTLELLMMLYLAQGRGLID